MGREFNNFQEAAEAYASGYRPGAPLSGNEDCNPASLWINGQRYVACGPTTGEWLSANDLEMQAVVQSSIGEVTFAC